MCHLSSDSWPGLSLKSRCLRYKSENFVILFIHLIQITPSTPYNRSLHR